MADRRGSVRLARVGTIDVHIHWSWLIIVVLLMLGLQGWLITTDENLDPAVAWLLAIGGTAVFLGSVLVHELAHALVARARGIEVSGITLFVFGGATEVDTTSRSARDELIVAIVGPLTSLAVGAVLGLAWLGLDPDAALGQMVGYLAVINVVLAVFNLLPGLPLDGGRVFRAIVWAATGDFARATRMASTTGVMVGYLLIGVGLVELWAGSVGGLWLAAIGWMISTSARQTGTQDRMRELFADQTAADLMTSPVVSIPAGLPVNEAVECYLARHPVTVFPVVSETGTGLIGTLGVGSVHGLTVDQARSMTAAQLANPVDPDLVVTADRSAADVIELLTANPTGSRVIVVEGSWPIGIVSPRDVIRRSDLMDLLRPLGSGRPAPQPSDPR